MISSLSNLVLSLKAFAPLWGFLALAVIVTIYLQKFMFFIIIRNRQ
jgi:hypothetical protein